MGKGTPKTASAKPIQYDEHTPYGSATWDKQGDRHLEFNPQDQEALDAVRGLRRDLYYTGGNVLPQVHAAYQNPLQRPNMPNVRRTGGSSVGIPGMEYGSVDIPGMQNISNLPGARSMADIKDVEQATYKRGYNLISPHLTRKREQLRAQLANQGLPMMSEAHSGALDRADQSEADQLENLALSSVGAGRQEASRLHGVDMDRWGAGRQRSLDLFGMGAQRFGMGQQRANRRFGMGSQRFGMGQTDRMNTHGINMSTYAAKRQKALDEFGMDQTTRQQPLRDLAALVGTVPMMPGAQPIRFHTPGTSQPQQQPQNNDFMQGLFGLGQAAIQYSDRRLKQNIREVGRLHNGLPVYAYEFRSKPWQTVIGLMADEVEAVNPDAVADIGGFAAVDYGKAVQ